MTNEVFDPDLTPTANAAAATERELGALHKVVAEALTTAIKEGSTVVDKEGNPIKVPASAAHLGAAIAFLKNNNITASPTENAALADLNRALNRKRRRGLSPEQLKEATDQFDAMQGANGLRMQ